MSGFLGRFLQRGEAASPFAVPGALGEKSHILAVDAGDLSDLLFHVPLLQAIRERFPLAQIDFLLPEDHTSLVVPSGLARHCMVYSRKQLRPWSPGFYSLVKAVRREACDMSLVMSFSPQPALELVALASGATLRLGPSHSGSYPAVNFEIRGEDKGSRYRGAKLRAAAPFLGLADLDEACRWHLPEDQLRRMRQLVHFNKPRHEEILVGVDPSLGKSGSGLAVKSLQFVVSQLASQMPCRVLPLSPGTDRDRLARFESGLSVPPLTLPHESLFDTILLVASCDLFLAGNTDLFHCAAALGVPTLGLFLDGDGPEWEPAGTPHASVLRVASGERVDIDTLMEAVEAVRGTP